MVSSRKSNLTQLTDLMPLQPWKTPSPPFNENHRNVQYIKLKEPLVTEDGSKVFWQPKRLHKEVDGLDIEIPYVGVFESFDKGVIKTIRRWIDKWR
jgi:hypothetical protein